MPQVPIWDRQIAPEAVNAGNVDTGLYTAPGQAFKETAVQVDRIAQQFQQIDELRKQTAAVNDLSGALQQIENEASNESDLDSFGDYERRIKEAIDSNVVKVPGKLAQINTKARFDTYGMQTSSRIQDKFRNKSIQRQKLETHMNLETLRLAYTGTTSKQEKKRITDEANLLVQKNFDAGIWTAKEAASYKTTIARKWPIDEARFDATTNPDTYDARRSDYGLNPQDLVATDDLANKTKEKQARTAEKQVLEQQLDNEINTVVSWASGKIPEDFFNQISEKVATGEISPEFGSAMQNVFSNPEMVELSTLSDSHAGFAELAEGIMALDSKEALKGGITALLDQSGKKKIPESDLAVLMFFAQKKYEEVNKGESFLGQWGKTINEMLTPAGAALATFKYVNKILENKEPKEASAQAVFEAASEINPELLKVSEEGTLIMDANGNKAMAYPDGRIEESK